MPLISKLFTAPRRDPKLDACLVDDDAHITPGARGDHVKSIQIALSQLIPAFLSIDGVYGPKTAAAVKAYKNAPSRKILQPYQTTADDIVGKRTIKSLDDEMDIFENELPLTSGLVSTTVLGNPHDHNTCPRRNPLTGSEGRSHHYGTPINPQGFGRMINLGGEGETNYLGFEDFLPNPFPIGPTRPFTSSLRDHCASDICLRFSPISKDGDEQKGKAEIIRIAAPLCRLTFCGDVKKFGNTLRSLGTVIEQVLMQDFFHDKPADKTDDLEAWVIAMR